MRYVLLNSPLSADDGSRLRIGHWHSLMSSEYRGSDAVEPERSEFPPIDPSEYSATSERRFETPMKKASYSKRAWSRTDRREIRGKVSPTPRPTPRAASSRNLLSHFNTVLKPSKIGYSTASPDSRQSADQSGANIRSHLDERGASSHPSTE